VALSRVKSLAGLWLSKPIQARSIRAHPAVLKFYGVKHEAPDSPRSYRTSWQKTAGDTTETISSTPAEFTVKPPIEEIAVEAPSFASPHGATARVWSPKTASPGLPDYFTTQLTTPSDAMAPPTAEQSSTDEDTPESAVARKVWTKKQDVVVSYLRKPAARRR
jgi:hypothetical protein